MPVSEIEAEDFNCNIRRYVDNAPPPEPHDVRAHLHGGVPVVEIESLGRYWSNYAGLRERVFQPRSVGRALLPVASRGAPTGKSARPTFETGSVYTDFTPSVTDRRALAELVKSDPGIAAAQETFQETLEAWWQKNAPSIEQLAPQNKRKGNVYELRRALLADIAETFAGQSLLTDHQVRGAFARYVDDLKADLKSIAASGWGAELIPDAEILQSQFPEVLSLMEQKRLRLAELAALFAAADEEDYEDSDDTGLLPADEVKTLKTELKELNAQAKLAKKEKQIGDWETYKAEAAAIEARLARHKGLEDEAKQLKSDLRATEKEQEELVAAARAKIDRDEARRVILDRLHRLLIETYAGYLRADQRACLATLENLHAKYAATAQPIESQRDAAAAKLKGFLKELGYE